MASSTTSVVPDYSSSGDSSLAITVLAVSINALNVSNNALNTSNTALSLSNNALNTSATAVANANSALNGANTAMTTAVSAQNFANTQLVISQSALARLPITISTFSQPTFTATTTFTEYSYFIFNTTTPNEPISIWANIDTRCINQGQLDMYLSFNFNQSLSQTQSLTMDNNDYKTIPLYMRCQAGVVGTYIVSLFIRGTGLNNILRSTYLAMFKI